MIWNYYIFSWISHWQIHKPISIKRALPRWSSMFASVFQINILCCRTRMKLAIGVTSKEVKHRKLATIGCYSKMWRRWTTNSTTEPKKRLSFINDRRHCYCCSRLKWRRGDATSMFMASTSGALRRKVNYVFLCVGRRLMMLPQKTV
jgi:hypothetical protein